jgi:2-dehydropantoate 2-reductase
VKYIIFGAGGTGGCLGGFLAKYGLDVTFIARGEHLSAMKSGGIQVHSDRSGNFLVKPVSAATADEYQGRADVIFLCVKEYSLSETIPFIKRVADQETVVIPILNVVETGEKLSRALPQITVADGCIYIVGFVSGPGKVTQRGQIFRLVFGMRDGQHSKKFEQIANDVQSSGIDVLLSSEIRREALIKFSFVSPMATAGAYFNACAQAFQCAGAPREMFINLIHEVVSLALAHGIQLPENIVNINLKILDDLTPETTTSMQKDLEAGRQSEIDGLLFAVVRMGNHFSVPVPTYTMIAEHFGFINSDDCSVQT